MATIANLNVKISADTKALLDGIGRVESTLGRFAGRVQGLFNAALAGLSVAKFVSMGREALKSAEALQQQAKWLGIGVEKLQAWEVGAREAGIEQGKLTQALDKMRGNLADAAADPKSGPAQIFAQLGISLRDAKGELLGLDKLIPALADKIKGLSTGDKLIVGKTLFGEKMDDVIRFLEGGSLALARWEAAARGVVWSPEFVATSAQLSRDIEKLETKIGKDLKQAVVDFAPAWKFALEAVVEVQMAVDRLLSSVRIGGLRLGKEPSATERLSEIESDLETARRRLAASQDKGGTPYDRMRREGPGPQQMLRDDIARLEKQRAFVAGLADTERAKSLQGAAADEQAAMLAGITVTRKKGDILRPRGPGDFEKDEKHLDEIGRQVVETERLVDALGRGEAAMAAAERENAIMAATSKLSASATQDQWQQAERLAGIQFDANRTFRDVQRILDEIKTPRERYIEEQARLNELLAAGAINQDQFNLALGKVRERMLENNALYQGAISLIDRMGEGIINFAFDGENAMQSFRNVAINTLKDIANEIFKLGALNPLKNALFGTDKFPTFANQGGFFGDLFGSLFGGAPGGEGIGGIAAGAVGGFATGGSFIVGGPGGTDQTPVRFNATRGERVTVETPGQQRRGGAPVIINMDLRGSNGDAAIQAAVMRGISMAAPVIVDQAEVRVRDGAARNPGYFKR